MVVAAEQQTEGYCPGATDRGLLPRSNRPRAIAQGNRPMTIAQGQQTNGYCPGATEQGLLPRGNRPRPIAKVLSEWGRPVSIAQEQQTKVYCPEATDQGLLLRSHHELGHVLCPCNILHNSFSGKKTARGFLVVAYGGNPARTGGRPPSLTRLLRIW